MLKLKELMKAIKKGVNSTRLPVIPFVMQFAARIAEISYRDYCRDPEAMAESQLRCLEKFDYDAVNVSSDAHRLAEALGGELFFPKNGVPVVKKPPIETERDLSAKSVPDPRDLPRCRQRLEAIEFIKNHNPEITVIGWIEGALSEASSIFGPNRALKAFYRSPDLLERLFRFSARFDKKFAKAQVEAGADVIGAGDSLASQVSTDSFELSVEYTKNIFNSLDVPVLYHVCGDTNHQLEVLNHSGADVVDLDREVNLGVARSVLGNETIIRGNIDPIAFVRKTPEEIENLSLDCIEEVGGPESFILSAGCEIPPDSRLENLSAMVGVATKTSFDR